MTNSLNVTKLRYGLLQKHQTDNIIEVRFLLMTISLSFTTFLKLTIISMQVLITFIAWAPFGETGKAPTSTKIKVKRAAPEYIPFFRNEKPAITRNNCYNYAVNLPRVPPPVTEPPTPDIYPFRNRAAAILKISPSKQDMT